MIDLIKEWGGLFGSFFSFGLLAVLFSYNQLTRQSREDREEARLAAKDMVITGLEERQKMLEERLKLRDETDSFKGKNRADPLAGTEHYDRIFERSEIIEFYNLVAARYDQRNMGQYGITYEKIFQIACRNIDDLSAITVCDVGGGTGWLLKKFKHLSVRWVNVDFAIATTAVFETKADYERIESRLLDVRQNYFTRPSDSFDLVVMSFLLSSIDGKPDYAAIRSAMKSNAIIIVADNHYSYAKDRIYGFDDIDGKNIGFQPKPMYPELIRAELQDAGFQHVDEDYISIDGNVIYSQIHVFKKA